MRLIPLVAVALLLITGAAADAGGEATKPAASPVEAAVMRALPPDVVDTIWEWTWFGSGAEQFDVDEPERYTIEFTADGNVAIQADCNLGRATYELTPDRMVHLSPIGVTMMLCPDDSLGDRFVKSLEQVRLYFEKDGDFFLEAPIGSGTLRFRRRGKDED